mgnify:CR=1 FL=1
MLYCGVVFLSMTVVTIHASLDRNVFLAAADLWSDPWGKATLFDTYFSFVAIWFWIAWREKNWMERVAWLVGILTLGNFAIAVYVFLSLRTCHGDPMTHLFTGKR